MGSPTADDLTSRRRIVVADEDPGVVAFNIQPLREDGHAVFHAHDGLTATELVLALNQCHLSITNTKVDGLPGVQLVHVVRTRLPDVPILRESFTADELRAQVAPMLDGDREQIAH
jgi:DNA-binding response OmpR family regulator